MLGSDAPYDVVPCFFSDLADWASLEYVRSASSWDEVIWRGERDSGQFLALYLGEKRVVGALGVGRSEELGEARRLLADRTDVSGHRELLADLSSDLGAVG